MLAPRKKLWSTPSSAVDIALDFASLDIDDVVYDVGCGDGRVLLQMAAMSIRMMPEEGARAHTQTTTAAVTASDHAIDSFAQEDQQQQQQQQQQRVVRNNSSSAINNIPSKNNEKHHYCHHYCHQFVGIEISPERAAEARNNILQAQQRQHRKCSSDDDDHHHPIRIPDHVSIEIICANALDTTIVDYSKATVLFLYLVPRGLRLIKGIVWPKKEDAEAVVGEGGDIAIGVEGGEASLLSADATTTTITTMKGRRLPRRIVTYMAPFENTPHVRKEYCKVEHQQGAAWPVYLYHVDI